MSDAPTTTPAAPADTRKFTAGPWRAAGPRVYAAPVDANSARRMVADCNSLLRSRTVADEANARLISAAPDLLAACVALIKTDDLQAAIDLARAAIEKAGAR